MKISYSFGEIEEAIAYSNGELPYVEHEIRKLAAFINNNKKESKQEEQFKHGQKVWFMHDNEACESEIEVTFSSYVPRVSFDREYITLSRDKIFATKEELIASL